MKGPRLKNVAKAGNSNTQKVLSENIYDILVSIRCLDWDRAPRSETEVFCRRSNVEFGGASKFPVSKCSFHLRTRGDVGLYVVSSLLLVTCKLCACLLYGTAVVFSHNFFSSRVFSVYGSITWCCVELHTFSRKLNVCRQTVLLHLQELRTPL